MNESFSNPDYTYIVLVVTLAFQVVSLFCCQWMIQKIGHDKTLAFYMGANGLSVIIFTATSPSFWGMFVAYGLFNFGTAGLFAVLYLLTNLCYPTQVRTTGFGICSSSNRAAGAAAPIFFGYLRNNYDLWICGAIVGSIFFLSMCFILVVERIRKGNPDRYKII